MTEHDHALWGADAVRNGTPDYDTEEAETNLVDTLANIMHHADLIGIDFEVALDSARRHHAAELAD